MLTKLHVVNFRYFERFTMEMNPGPNILVGDNDAGKSTLLEAIALALTGRVGGRSLATDLSPFHFNSAAVRAYAERLKKGLESAPPEILVELFLQKSDDTVKLQGTNNSFGEDSPGIRVRAYPDPDLGDEFLEFLKDPGSMNALPVEYYKVDWLGFSGNAINAHAVPAVVSMIDASTMRLQSGTDFYLQQIVNGTLTKAERAQLARDYRMIREDFATHTAVASVNDKLAEAHGDVSDRALRLSIDLSQRSAWEGGLAPHLDELPLQYVGKGEQSTLKVLLALSRVVEKAHVLLIEEPENHLSFASLNMLLSKIEAKCAGKQVFITTHSSYVLNKLGLGSLVLMGDQEHHRLTDLEADSTAYFKKLPGYDTLRLILARQVVLVEGPSDELVFQRAYLDRHGKLPIHDGIDVLSVRGLSFKRFLGLAVALRRRTVLVRDNDGEPAADVLERYSDYTAHDFISVRVGLDNELKTLEPQLLAVNGLASINAVLGKAYLTDDELLKYMNRNKTTCALAIFESDTSIEMPPYIVQALDDVA